MAVKQKLLIACDYWHPVTSANLVCVEAIAPYLTERYDLVFLTADPEPPTYAGIKGRCVDDLAIKRLLDSYKDRPIRLGLIKMGNKFAVAANLFRFPIRAGKMVRDYEAAIVELLSEGGFAGVLAICYPGECVEACVRVRSYFPDIFFVAYFLDELAVGMYRKGKLIRRISSKAAVDFESRALDEFDGAIFLNAARKLVERNHPQQLDNIRYVDVPFMRTQKLTYQGRSSTIGPITLLYAGTLANPDRNPMRFIEVVMPLIGSRELKLKFAGDNAGLLDGVEGVEKLGLLASDACDALMGESDVLLSIGNRDPYLIPSKIFKYMGLGKPIIHLTRGDRDSCIPYLERYPLALLVDESETGVLASVKKFLYDLPSKNGLEISLGELFPMAYPEYTVEAIESIAMNHREAVKE